MVWGHAGGAWIPTAGPAGLGSLPPLSLEATQKPWKQ